MAVTIMRRLPNGKNEAVKIIKKSPINFSNGKVKPVESPAVAFAGNKPFLHLDPSKYFAKPKR